ncbi:metalloregulator ArsR/SmtB family transcription factor [Curtobacterium sp. MCPF17_002]|uniref:ArsR/SmtB family transcription factor n=1 Tax=Curtobacterium sp. MCPF17_002 TaxID=2175645 RepID=UPI000DA88E8B|nr:metalloregulator ArsR/SmtB family transcription factor [Curtobacterium sp. MCPF17_002]WIB77270.1 metalloregulator ArsR/SmtB family transcription factor [Curtobacterium sp. MCPF17_002]
MHAFDVLGDPVRRRLVELLAEDDHTAGALTDVIAGEFGISQPAVSRHLRVLREAGFASAAPRGTSRVYRLEARAVDELDHAVERYRALWRQRLDALTTEIARGRRQRPDAPRPEHDAAPSDAAPSDAARHDEES